MFSGYTNEERLLFLKDDSSIISVSCEVLAEYTYISASQNSASHQLD